MTYYMSLYRERGITLEPVNHIKMIVEGWRIYGLCKVDSLADTLEQIDFTDVFCGFWPNPTYIEVWLKY